jgi:3-oxoacyl-[acyl-carrier-protein] synthase II/beta-ketoacyl ACP synthase
MSYRQQMSRVLGQRLWGRAGSLEIDTRRLLVSIRLGLGSTEESILQYYDWRERGMRAVSPLA